MMAYPLNDGIPSKVIALYPPLKINPRSPHWDNMRPRLFGMQHKMLPLMNVKKIFMRNNNNIVNKSRVIAKRE
jgi:hypothetical protein